MYTCARHGVDIWLENQSRKKEEHFRMELEYPDGKTKYIYPIGREKVNSNKEYCKKHDIKVLSCKKLYPFNMWNNQHNFELIYNICWNRLWDMDNGEAPYDKEEYNRLWKMKERAGYFETMGCGVVWLPYEEWKEAKEMASNAVIHRQEACIANGRPDLVKYC